MHDAPPFFGVGLSHSLVRHKHVSMLLDSWRWSSVCWLHLNQSLQADQPPSIGALDSGHSLACWIQNRFNGSPSGAVVHFCSKSFQPQYGSIEFKQLGREPWRLQCWAGMRITVSSVPIYNESVCLRKCMVSILETGSVCGCQISMTHVSLVRGKMDNFFTKLSSLATYMMSTRLCVFVATTSNVMCVSRSSFVVKSGSIDIGCTASSINWKRCDPIKRSWRIDGTGLNLHSNWLRSSRSLRSHNDEVVSWCLNGPLNAAFIDDKLNAQIAEPLIILFLYITIKRLQCVEKR